MSNDLYIFGTGSHARKVFNYATTMNFSVKTFVDETPKDSIFQEKPVVSFASSLEEQPAKVFIAIGNPDVRKRISDIYTNAGWKILTLIHPTAYVARDATVENGVLVAAGAIIETGVKIGRGAIVDIGVIIDHDCIVSEFSHLKAGTVLQPTTKF
ncbi:MAG: hypothetical protein ACKOX6_05155 [Bdellovibrio sp.]